MSKENKTSIWDVPEMKGGITLNGLGDLPTEPGPHRSFSYYTFSGKNTEY